MLPLSWMENEKVSHFANHIVPNSYASDWLDTLTRNDMASPTTICTVISMILLSQLQSSRTSPHLCNSGLGSLH